MSMVRIVTRIVPSNASSESVACLLTADQIDIPVRSRCSTTGSIPNAVSAETTFCKAEIIPPDSDPDVAVAAKCKAMPSLACLKKSRLRLTTIEHKVDETPVIKVSPEVSDDGRCSGMLLSIPLRIPRSEIHASSVQTTEGGFLKNSQAYVEDRTSHLSTTAEQGYAEGSFLCNVCDKSFQNPLQLQYHKKSHKTKLPCGQCGKKFQSKKRLASHMKAHCTDIQCPFCEKRLSTGKLLKDHMSIHAGELPHECTLCHERFRSAHTLQEHSRQHKNEERFSCYVCGQEFHKRGLLKAHMNAVHKE